MQAVGGGLSGLAAQFSDESALEVCIHVMRYTNRQIFLLYRPGRRPLIYLLYFMPMVSPASAKIFITALYHAPCNFSPIRNT